MINLFSLSAPAIATTPEIIRFDANQMALLPFTPELTPVKLHFVDFAETRGYVRCNGSDCLLCRMGVAQVERYLMPVYQPVERRIGILMISPTMRPKALLPQLLEAMRPFEASGERPVLYIRRPDPVTFDLQAEKLPTGIDDGAELVSKFRDAVAAGTVKLEDAIQVLSNEQLKAIEPVRQSLALRGIKL